MDSNMKPQFSAGEWAYFRSEDEIKSVQPTDGVVESYKSTCTRQTDKRGLVKYVYPQGLHNNDAPVYRISGLLVDERFLMSLEEHREMIHPKKLVVDKKVLMAAL